MATIEQLKDLPCLVCEKKSQLLVPCRCDQQPCSKHPLMNFCSECWDSFRDRVMKQVTVMRMTKPK